MYKRNTTATLALCVCALSGVVIAQAQTARGTPTPTSAPTTGAPADNTAINERDKSPDTMKSTDQPNNSADIQLAAAVRKAIVDDKSLSTAGHNVKLVAANGVVTLRGPVKSDAEKAKLARIASGITGVSSVDNQIDVKSE